MSKTSIRHSDLRSNPRSHDAPRSEWSIYPPWLRVPRPTYVKSRLMGREQPDAEMYSAFAHLAEVYELGEIVSCNRAPRSNSMNFLVTTEATERNNVGRHNAKQHRYVFRRHNLSKETVAHEYEILSHLERKEFPAPRMLVDSKQRAWTPIKGALYSVYALIEGFRPCDFWWPPRQESAIRRQAGATLAKLHQTLAGMEPTSFKWDAYQASSRLPAPTTPGTEQISTIRWRDGDLYRRALTEIRSQVSKKDATNNVDEFARSRIADLERLIAYDSLVEGHPDLNKVVIHGDYAPWNLLMKKDGSLCILDFNASRLDLRIYDIMLATMWFAWRGDHLDLEIAKDLQTGYCSNITLTQAEIELAPKAFCWLLGRSIAERLRVHYQEQRLLISNPATLEHQYQMCAWAEEHPEQLTCGLRAAHGQPESSRSRSG